MYLSLNNRTLKIYGIGVANYDGDTRFIFGFKTIDTCVKDIKNGCYDVGVIDSRDMVHSLRVDFGTITSLVAGGLCVASGYLITKKLLM